MNELISQLRTMQEENPQRLYVMGGLVVFAVAFLIYTLSTSGKSPGNRPARPAPATGTAAVPGGAAAPTAESYLPPEVQTAMNDYQALSAEEKASVLSASQAPVGEMEVALGQMPALREKVKLDPFRPVVGPGSEVTVVGRPSLLPQLAELVREALERGEAVPEVMTYERPAPEIVAPPLPDVPALPDLPPVPGGPVAAQPQQPEAIKFPYRLSGVVIDGDPIAMLTNDQGQSLFARVGTQLEPGLEVAAIAEETIRVKTPMGIKELSLEKEKP